MAGLVLRKCPCLRPKIEEEVRVLDYRHSSLTDVPGDVFNFERTLEELYTDSNQIRDLPRELFYCHGLRKLSISDNEITSIPPAIASLDHLEELDFSKNGIIDVPDNIKCCKYLRVLDASVNPLGKLPEGFTQLQNLTHLCLNDTFLDYLPGSFGRLVKLKILEIRENHLKTLPKSFGRLSELERLDIGNNEFTDLPDVVGSLSNLLELWCDNNQITSITHTIGALKQLMFLDASKNQLESLPGEIEGCTCLADLHLSSNLLQSLPDAIGNLTNLTTLKADDNQLSTLPKTLGGLASLSELNVSVNDIEDLPASIGLLRNLRTFYADENLLTFVPSELGSCSGITVLSLRSNKLSYIPDEIGRIPRLRVLNLSDNCLSYLPFTIVKLKELQALWLTENQTRPLIPLQSDYEADTGRKILTCYLLPQGHNSDNDENGGDGDADSFHASIWDEERLRRQQIHFNFADNDDDQGHLVRCPTPYPKEMREKARHMRNLAMRQSMGDGAEASGWSPKAAENNQSLLAEGKDNYGLEDDETIDVRVREARIAKPQSPSLQETHRLYRFDKEKLMKDKARMQHRHSMPSIPDDLVAMVSGTPRSIKRGKSDDCKPLLGACNSRTKGRRETKRHLKSSWSDKDTGKGTSVCVDKKSNCRGRSNQENTSLFCLGKDRGSSVCLDQENKSLVCLGKDRGSSVCLDQEKDNKVMSDKTAEAKVCLNIEKKAELGLNSENGSEVCSTKENGVEIYSSLTKVNKICLDQDRVYSGGEDERKVCLNAEQNATVWLHTEKDTSVWSDREPDTTVQLDREKDASVWSDREPDTTVQLDREKDASVWSDREPDTTVQLDKEKESCICLDDQSKEVEQESNSCDGSKGNRGLASSDTEDVRVTGRRKSTPNLFNLEETDGSGFNTSNTSPPKRMPSFTYEDLYQKQLLHKHHHHHGRRSRRMRDYDSDTGYRSDRETHKFHRQFSGSDARDDLSVRSQPTMSRSHRRSNGREVGYASDLESYAGRGRGGWVGVGSSKKGSGLAPSPTPKPAMYKLYPTNSLPQDLDARTPKSGSAQDLSSSQQLRQPAAATPSSHVNSGNYPQHPGGPPSPAPSPSQFNTSSMLDQSIPLTSKAPQGFPPGFQPGPAVYSQAPEGLQTGAQSGSSSGYSHTQPGVNVKERDVQRELYTVLEERKRKSTMTADSRPSPTPSTSRNPVSGQTPPPYQPAPPYRRFSDRSDSFNSNSQNSPRDTQPKSGSSFSNPEYTAIQYSGNKRRGSGGGEWGAEGGQGGDRGREYETVASVRQGGDSVYSSGINHHQQQQQDQHRTYHQQGYREGGGNHQGYGGGARTRAGDSTLSRGDQRLPPHASDHRMGGPDYSVSPYGASAGMSHPHPSYSSSSHTPMHPSITTHPPTSYPDRARDQLTAPVTMQYSHNEMNSARHSPHTLDLSSSSRSRSGSREVFMDRRGSRGDGSLTPSKGLEVYPNPYGEPLEVGDPLMSRFEDVAMFKNMQDPSSQVSSSTDSGYGHGHHIYERIGDFPRRSGSPHSSTPPSQRNTPVQRHNSSSQGTPSRETTPVKEEGFYSVQGNHLSESTTQESREVFRVVIRKNPGLGFSIAGGQGSRGFNPYRTGDQGIFVTKVQPGGPAATLVHPGDKILEVNHIDFRSIDHNKAVNVMKTSSSVELLVERVQKINMV